MFSRRTAWNLATNPFTEAHRASIARGQEVLDLAASNPTRVGLTFDSAAILDSLRQDEALDYDPQAKGLRSAREAVAEYYSLEHGGQSGFGAIDPETVLLTTSTSEGYGYLFRLLCNPEDEVLVPKPSYPLFEFLADLQDVKLTPYPLFYDHGWQIDLDALRQAITPRTRAVMLVHPNNPTGSYVNSNERVALNELCIQHDLCLIVDEVFLDYPHDGRQRFTFTQNEEALTFTLSGLSKVSGLPQMKLAWIVISGPASQARPALDRLEVIADTYLSMNAPIQLAAPVLLDQRHSIQPALMERIRQNLAELDAHLARQKSCERLQVEGGWHAVLRVPQTLSDEELSIALLREVSVLLHPGHFYDFPRDGYLILSLITPTVDFREGMGRVLMLLGNS